MRAHVKRVPSSGSGRIVEPQRMIGAARSQERIAAMTSGLIDFHHHARPAAYFEALIASGRSTVGGRTLPPAWTADGALANMDRMGIATALVSAPDADLLYRDRPVALEMSRMLNDLFAKTIASHPARFGAFASLPMPHMDDTLRELAHALDDLKLDGVMLSTSYAGRYLGDPELDPLLADLDRRAALVFVHPVTPMGIERLALDFPAPLLEYAFDTTRCIANLLRRDVPARFPRLKMVFSHAGGAVPWLVPRLALMSLMLTPSHEVRVAEDRARIVRGLRSYFYDVAMSGTDPVLGLLAEIVGTDRIVFGSDYPLVPDAYIAATADAVLHSDALDEGQRRAIARDTALRLLPRFA